MHKLYDICIIGSGAGAGPIAYELTKAGAKVLILEKGSFYSEKDFSKDEIAFVRRNIITPSLKDEFHTIEEFTDNRWIKTSTYDLNWSFWNGNIIGGSSNFMSGYFHRLKPNDFKLKSVYGEIEGGNIVDWPIDYEELEPYYEKVERLVGVSGNVTKYRHCEPRSTRNFPYPPTKEHPIVKLFDKTCKDLKITPFKTPRAILTDKKDDRYPCYYSNYCGSYGCSSGAKGSSRASLLVLALQTNNLTIKTNAFVSKLITNEKKQIVSARYFTKDFVEKEVKAKIFVVAAQAVESSRLLLNSKNRKFPYGLANSSKEVGKNLLFSGGGIGSCEFDETVLPNKELFVSGLFVNRAIKDWYYTKDFKGGTIDFLFDHPNPIRRANKLKWENKKLLWGKKLQDKIFNNFTKKRNFNFEIFTDWIPNDNCFVSVDEKYKDKYKVPVANIRIGSHVQNLKVSNFLAFKGKKILKKMGGKNIKIDITPLPSPNLQAGGCRFGDDPKTSVLNRYCQSHDIENLFVTDGSFMPTGGSVPYTWTIYANSFRVADYIKKF